jgi:hypothetical protein
MQDFESKASLAISTCYQDVFGLSDVFGVGCVGSGRIHPARFGPENENPNIV